MAQSTLRGKRSVPLTTSNVLAVVREVKRWWGGLGSGSLTRTSTYLNQSRKRSRPTSQMRWIKSSRLYPTGSTPTL
ncbi:hypothetical protein GBAR_LOCUS4295 [Geodia barretti]|uniref:Uncharacterized protein n=1 Tax=Geodia barretti TaxID=519541 RepID=A0AA35W9Z9_GEOBA|nr:hypothetical protein GBAR_LOCUS4295 [Geodia barretti]